MDLLMWRQHCLRLWMLLMLLWSLYLLPCVRLCFLSGGSRLWKSKSKWPDNKNLTSSKIFQNQNKKLQRKILWLILINFNAFQSISKVYRRKLKLIPKQQKNQSSCKSCMFFFCWRPVHKRSQCKNFAWISWSVAVQVVQKRGVGL